MIRWFLGLLALVFAAQGSLRAEIVQSSVLENDVAYLRVGAVDTALAGEIGAAEKALAVSNKIAGIVLDLRFAGDDGATADFAATNFLTTVKLPLAILVNGDTTGAATDFAAQLRAADAGIVIGSTNASVTPDIAVMVTAADEKKFLTNPYAILTPTNTVATNDWLPFIEHTSEADLVRQKVKDGDEDAAATPNRPAPAKPVIRDPALARAVDFLKALAILPKARG